MKLLEALKSKKPLCFFLRKPSAEEIALKGVRESLKNFPERKAKLISHTIRPMLIKGKWTTIRIQH